uniref:Uncharacterized protein n=1 Tax=Glossina brevipalpis TaxID=37001 RepID=A0A1A9WHE9_9MUSC
MVWRRKYVQEENIVEKNKYVHEKDIPEKNQHVAVAGRATMLTTLFTSLYSLSVAVMTVASQFVNELLYLTDMRFPDRIDLPLAINVTVSDERFMFVIIQENIKYTYGYPLLANASSVHRIHQHRPDRDTDR